MLAHTGHSANKNKRTLEWLLAGALILVLLLRGRNVAVAFWNNLVSVALIPGWQVANRDINLPHCGQREDQLEMAWLLDLTMSMNSYNERVLMNLARVRTLVGDCETALNNWYAVVSKVPNDPIASLELGNTLYAVGQYNEAVNLYREIGAGRYLHGRAAIAKDAGNDDVAALWHELGLEVSPISHEGTKWLANYYLQAGRHEDATLLWQNMAASTMEDNSEHWWALGQLAEFDGLWDRALEIYGRGARLAENPRDFYLQMGKIYWHSLEDFVEAERHFHLAQEAVPGDVWSYLFMGMMEQEQEHYDAALDWYQRADEVQPDHEIPEMLQGKIFWEQRQISQAHALFFEASAENPQNAEAWYFLGLSENEMGDLELSIAYMKQAIELRAGPKSWRWYLLLADWYAEADRCQEADDILEQVRSWQLDDEVIQQFFIESKCR